MDVFVSLKVLNHEHTLISWREKVHVWDRGLDERHLQGIWQIKSNKYYKLYLIRIFKEMLSSLFGSFADISLCRLIVESHLLKVLNLSHVFCFFLSFTRCTNPHSFPCNEQCQKPPQQPSPPPRVLSAVPNSTLVLTSSELPVGWI